MTQPGESAGAFAYRAQTHEGRLISGTINAADRDEALRKLQSLQLQQIQLEPEQTSSRSERPPGGSALRGEDFLAFNQQLAQLTGAGLPVEQGLRLIASEMRRSSMRQTLQSVAGDLESGKTLPQAVAAHRHQFPPLYSQLIDAGIRAGNLSGILLNLGKHLTLVRRLQAALWEALSYPAIIMVAFFGVFYFILVGLVPRWEPMIGNFKGMQFWVRAGGTYESTTYQIPAITRLLFAISEMVSAVPGWVILAAIIVVALAVWGFLRLTGRRQSVAERLILPLPFLGGVLRQNLISRWCHAVALATEAGLDLPAAITLADDATASPRLRTDGAALISAINAGQSISSVPAGRIIPATVIAAMDSSAMRGDLPLALRALAQMYQQQAELRLGAVQAVLAPGILLLVGIVIGLLMLALFLPLLTILNML
jgi:type IV pilus assembly protein PilC